MRSTFVNALAINMAYVLTASAQSQSPPYSFPPTYRGIVGIDASPFPVSKDVLLMKSAVRDELKVTDDQWKQISKIGEERLRASERLHHEWFARRQEIGDPADAQLDSDKRHAIGVLSQQIFNDRRSLGEKAEAAKLRILGTNQRTRLDQIHLQAEGPLAFSRPEVQERLNLSPGQIEMIGTILARGRASMMEASAVPIKPGMETSSPENVPALIESKEYKTVRGSMLKTRDATMLAIAKTLTKKQRENYRKMLGKPFDVANVRNEDLGLPIEKDPKIQNSKPTTNPTKHDEK